jgi:O-antigen ligase
MAKKTGSEIIPETGAAALGWAAFALLAERFLFAALIVLMPFRWRSILVKNPVPPIVSDFTDTLLFAADVCLAAVLLLWAARLAAARRKPKWGLPFVTLPLAGLTAVGALSVLWSVAPGISGMHALRLLFLLGLYLYVVNEVHSLRAIALPLAVQVAVQGVVAAAQFLMQRSVGLQAFGEYALSPDLPGVSIVWAPGRLAMRSYGLSDHPNIAGGGLALGLLLLAGVYLRAKDRARLPLSGVIFVGAAGLLFSFSRSAWGGLLAGGMALGAFLLVRRLWRELAALGLLGASGAVVLLPLVISSLPLLQMRLALPADLPDPSAVLLSPEQQSILDRVTLADLAKEMYAQNPLLGVGLGAFPVAMMEQFPGHPAAYQPVHIILLDAAVETGFFGGLCYLLLSLLPWAALWLARGRVRLTHDLAAASAALAAAAFIGLFDYYLWFLPTGRLWQWLVWGLWAAAFQKSLRQA